MPNINKRFGEKVAMLRYEKRYSLTKMSNLTGIDRGYMSKIEKAECNVSIQVAEKISKALEVPLKTLFD